MSFGKWVKRVTFASFVFCLGLLAGPVPAQTEADDLSDSLGDETLLFEDIPSVYGASKYEQKVTEAPSSVSIVTAEEIAKYGYRTLADLLRSLRGFYTTYDRNYHYAGVRGFGIPGDYNTRILLLIDGHRTNDSVYDAAPIGTDFLLDVDLIDRVEVVRGPSSSIYGSNAFFAVVNVITQRGRDYQGVEASGEGGSQDTYKGRLTLGHRFAGGFEGLLSGTFYTSDGDDDLYFAEFDDPATNHGRAEDADDDEYYSVFGEAALHDFTLQGAFVDRDKKIPTAPWETVFNDNDTETWDKFYYANLKYQHTFADYSQLLARASYNVYEYDGDYVFDWDETGEEPYLVPNQDGGNGKWWGVEGQYARTLFEKHKVSAGGEYRDNFELDQWNYDRDGEDRYEYLDSREDSEIWALYLQDEFRILENLILNAGVRHDHYSTFGGTTNPRLALIYTPVQKTTLKFLYGTAFRAPNAYELYYDDGELETQKANSDLDPETIRTFEAVWEQYLGDHLRGVVAGFYYEIDDLIVLTTDPTDELLVFDNVDEVEAKGVELELEGKWPGIVEGRVSYTYQKTENADTGDWLVNSPKHLAKFNVIAPVFREILFTGLEVQYTSKRKTPQDTEVDDFFVTNLTFFARPWLEGLEFSATVYNVFDEEYEDPASEEHTQAAIEQDGRLFRVKLSYLF
jgi:iron complex outermembrane receptor protein